MSLSRIAIKAALAINFTLAAFSALVLLTSHYHGLKPDTDFTPFYVGWSIVRDGKGPQLYNLQLQREYETMHGEMLPEVEVAPYLNPPQWVLPFLPISYLSRINAARVWLGIQLLFLLLMIRNLWLISIEWTKEERVYLVSAVLASTMLVYTLYQGAFSLLLLMCVTFLYRAQRENWKSGVWLTLGTIKPQLILFPAVMLLARRFWRAILTATAISCVLIAASLPFVGWRSYVEYLAVLGTVGSEFSNRYGAPVDTMANLKGLLANFTNNGSVINMIVYLALFAGIVFTLYLWRRSDRFNLRFALTVLLGLFLSPHLNDQDVLIAALPTALLYDRVRGTSRERIVSQRVKDVECVNAEAALKTAPACY